MLHPEVNRDSGSQGNPALECWVPIKVQMRFLLEIHLEPRCQSNQSKYTRTEHLSSCVKAEEGRWGAELQQPYCTDCCDWWKVKDPPFKSQESPRLVNKYISICPLSPPAYYRKTPNAFQCDLLLTYNMENILISQSGLIEVIWTDLD